MRIAEWEEPLFSDMNIKPVEARKTPDLSRCVQPHLHTDPAIYEPSRRVPIVQSTDVVVCGGGPAGAAAALAAARAGARTTLLECHGCLGGVWTTGLLSWVLDAEGKPGIMAEIARELDRRKARTLRVPQGKGFAYDPEQMKALLEELCLSAGIHLRYHTRVVSALRTPDGKRISAVITESKSGREAWAAKTFVDTTGDGDLGALAGCRFEAGRPGTEETQPMSMIGLLAGLRFPEIESYVGGGLEEPKQRLYAKLAELGVGPSNSVPLLVRIYDDLFALCANHEYGVKTDDASGITRATIHGRAETLRAVEAMRTLGPAWSQIRLVATAEQIGIRDGRRILGKYVVSDEDLHRGRRHEDAICRVHFPIDVHSTNRTRTKGIEAQPAATHPYDIPLRALIAADVDGLLMAGRCLSGDFLAHSSYRVTGNAVATGEAAGIAAAAAIELGTSPHGLTWQNVKPFFASQQANRHP